MNSMTSRQRMLAALTHKNPDRLPVTTHHVMQYFLDVYLGGKTSLEFFDFFGLDAYRWIVPIQGKPGLSWVNSWGQLESDSWRITREQMIAASFPGNRYTITTPRGCLTMAVNQNVYTEWVTERLIKQKTDIDLLGEFLPAPICDCSRVKQTARELGERGLVRGHIPCFDIYGQPGCWQDAACLVGIEALILATYDDPDWVHELLGILLRRKLDYIHSLPGAS
jgi:hypothetical protein